MTAPKFWPEVADALAELNLLARAQLARLDERLPWPDWAPAPGSWIRQAVVWNSGRRSHGPTWHIAGPVLWEEEWDYRPDDRVRRDFRFKPLCGRVITVHRPGEAFDHITLDVRLAITPDDHECAHCLRKLALIGEVAPGRRYFTGRIVSRS